MNNIINIKEKFKVDDSHSKIRGFVCAYDAEGKLVFSKENMIVESGRRFILNNGIKVDSLKYVFLSENGTHATPGDLLTNMGDIVKTTDNFPLPLTDNNFEKISIESGLIDVEDQDYKENLIVLLEDEDGDGIKEKTETGVNVRDDKNYFSYIIDQEQLVIKCLICFNDKSSIAAKSLGIVVNNGTEDVLFSRVTFPTYYKSNHQRLTFRYYIYF